MKKIFSILSLTIIMVSCGKKQVVTEHTFPLTVDYSKTIAEVISQGYYHDVERDLHAKFTFNDSIVDTIVKHESVLLNFDEKNDFLDGKLSLEEIKSHMKTRGLRPATAKELYTFGVVQPHVQVGVQIIGIGSQSLDGAFPILGIRDGGRGAGSERPKEDYSWIFENKLFFLTIKE